MKPEPPFQPQGVRPADRGAPEERDANARWIFGIVLGLLLAGLLVHGVLYGLLGVFQRKPQPTDAWQPVAPHAGYNPSPAIPRLQISPPRDWQRFSTQEEQQLTTYGWINRTAGVVRLPIARAMDLVLQRGLPSSSGNAGSSAGPSTYQMMEHRLSTQPSTP